MAIAPEMEAEFARVRAMVFDRRTLFRVEAMRGRFVNVSEAGYRLNGEMLPWPPESGVTSVFVFGASTVFGYGVRDEDTIAAHLQRRLTAETGAAVRVYNFACPNFDFAQSRSRFEELLLAGARPRAAVFVNGFADLVAPFYGPAREAPFVEALKPASAVRRLIGVVGGQRARVAADVPPAAAVVEACLRNRELIEAMCDRLNVVPLFVWQPAPCYRYDGDSRRSDAGAHGPEAAPILDYVRRGYDLMRAQRRAGDARLLWLADMQEGRTDNLYVDADHYSPAFSREIAQAIAERLRPAIAPRGDGYSA